MKPAGYDMHGRQTSSACWELRACPGLFCQWSLQIPQDRRRPWGVFYAPGPERRDCPISDQPGMMVAMALNGQRFATRRDALQAAAATLELEQH